MSSYTRKLQAVGYRSFSVSLPKKWVLEHKLDKSRIVNIQEAKNNLIISKNNIISSPYKVTVNVDDIRLVKNIIMLCYVKGVSELTLKFIKKDQYIQAKPLLTEILSHVEGFKITDENVEQVTISYFYTKTEIKIARLAKRTVAIINHMIECLRKQQNTTIKILEDEMDSLFHLSKRILYLASTDLEVRTTNNILDLEEIFLWRIIFKKFESIADIIEHTSSKSKEKIKYLERMMKYLNNIFILKKIVDISKIDFLRNQEIDENGLQNIKDLVVDIMQNYLLIVLNRRYFGEE